MKDRLRTRLTVGPKTYEYIALWALGMLTLIIMSGAAVRLTGSGLGCPTWPKCTEDSVVTELNTHGAIENANRFLTFVVGLPTFLAVILGYTRTPFRRDLVRIAWILPLGVVGQAVLGGLTVLFDLKPGFVMGHFMLSIFILIGAFALWWRSRLPDDPEERRAKYSPLLPRRATLAARALVPFGLLVVFLGTASTAAGPHTGGEGTDDLVPRMTIFGDDTLDTIIAGHARVSAVFGVCTLVFLIMVWRRQAVLGRLLMPLVVLNALMAAQGILGNIQYHSELPGELVWLHVSSASFTWLAILWVAFAAGPVAPREPAGDPQSSYPLTTVSASP